MMEVIGAAWVVFAAGYILFRRPWYQFAAYLLRPFVKHFLRRGIPWKDLLLRASSLNLVTGITWYICETVFSVNASQVSMHRSIFAHPLIISSQAPQCFSAHTRNITHWMSHFGYQVQVEWWILSTVCHGRNLGACARFISKSSRKKKSTVFGSPYSEPLVHFLQGDSFAAWQRLSKPGAPRKAYPPW